MNILILNWKDVRNPYVGGAEIIAFEFATRLAREGHEVTFFSRSFKGAKKEESIDGVKVIRTGNRFSVYPHAFFYYKSLKDKPDIVVDMINTICWQTPLYVPKEKRIAYVNQLAKEVFFFELPKPLSFVAYLLEEFQYLTYKNTRFLCYSESTKKDLEEYKINGKNIEIFPMGLNHTRYKANGKKASYPLFIYVGRLVKMKRVDLCIKAFGKVVKLHKNAKLEIVGNGPDEKRLFSIAKKNNLLRNVVFAGKSEYYPGKPIVDNKVKLMREAWALLLPSVKEGWGMVVTEAAACGTPSVVSDVTGLRDSVVKNKTGLILTKDPSPHELSDAMIKIIKDEKLRQKLSAQAVIWADNFNWDKSFFEFKKYLLK